MNTPDSQEKGAAVQGSVTPTSTTSSGNSNPASRVASRLNLALDVTTTTFEEMKRPTFLREQVICDGHVASIILALFCLISGILGVTCFLACYSWAGFQSANTAQVGIALAETFSRGPGPWEPMRFHVGDQQALCSLLAFTVGTQIPRIFPIVGIKSRTRLFFILNTFLQVLMTGAAALTAYKCNQPSFARNRDEPSWTDSLGFTTIALLASSLGAQGVLGEHASTPYTSTCVATSLFCQLGMLPRTKMLHLGWSKPRDVKLLAIFAIMFGAFCGRAVVGASNSSVAIAVGACVKLIATCLWLFCPGQPWDPALVS